MFYIRLNIFYILIKNMKLKKKNLDGKLNTYLFVIKNYFEM